MQWPMQNTAPFFSALCFALEGKKKGGKALPFLGNVDAQHTACRAGGIGVIIYI